MARESMPWFRFYCEAVWDRKLRGLDPDLRWLWVAILAAAGASPVRGTLLLAADVPLVVDDLADAANLPVSRVDAGIRAFTDRDMLTVDGGAWVVTHWGERQFASDSSTERSRRSRSNGDATSQQRSGGVAASPSDPESDTEPPSISGLAQYGLDEALVVDLLARHDLKVARNRGTAIANEDGWLVTARRKAATKYANKARETADTFTVDSERTLVDFITGDRRPTVADRRPA